MKKYWIYCLLCFLGACAKETVTPNEPYYRVFDLLQYGNRETDKEFPILSGLLPLKNGNVVVWRLTAFGNIAYELDKEGNKVKQYALNTKYPNQFAMDFKGIAYLEERDGGLWGMDWSGRLFTDQNTDLGYVAEVTPTDNTYQASFGEIHHVSKLSNGNYLLMLKKQNSLTIDLKLVNAKGETLLRKEKVIHANISFLHTLEDRTLAYPNMTTWEDKGFLKCLMSVRERSFVYKYYLIDINLNDLNVKSTPFETKNIANNFDKELNNYIGEGWGFGYQGKFFTCFIERKVFATNFTESSVYYIENESRTQIIKALNTPVPLNSSGTDLFIIPHKEDFYLVHTTRNYNIEIIKYSGLDSQGLPIERKRRSISFGFLAYLLNAKISEDGDLFLLTEPTSDEMRIGIAVMKIPKEEL